QQTRQKHLATHALSPLCPLLPSSDLHSVSKAESPLKHRLLRHFCLLLTPAQIIHDGCFLISARSQMSSIVEMKLHFVDHPVLMTNGRPAFFSQRVVNPAVHAHELQP